MKLRFNREQMQEALAAVREVAASRTPKEILRCVRMEVQADVLLLAATDGETSLRYAVTEVEVESPGCILVLADTFYRIVHECVDDVLTVESEGNMLHIRGATSHFQIVTQDPEEFPAVAAMEGEADFTIEFGAVRRLIEWTVFASARESTRYAINGVLWELDGNKLTLAATDGRRLSVAHGSVTLSNSKSLGQVIIPSKVLTLLTRLGIDADATVGVKMSENQVRFNLGRVMLGSSLVEGHFPKYQDVVPKDCDRIVEVNTSDFQAALRQAALLTNEESRGVRLNFEEDKLTLSSRAPEQGEATISISIRYKGEPMEIGFNPTFLLDALRVAHTDEIVFALKESNRPGVVRVGKELLYVVMPVNLTSA